MSVLKTADHIPGMSNCSLKGLKEEMAGKGIVLNDSIIFLLVSLR
jgi:hypothetical protein